MAERKRRSKRKPDPLVAHRRIRTPMPPPGRVIRDRRREREQDRLRRDLEET